MRLYENLVDEEKGVYDKETGLVNVNPNSLTIIPDAVMEPALKDAKAGESFQFVRSGYYNVDPRYMAEGRQVFGRIVSMKSSFKLPK